MDVATITAPADEARAKWQEYRDALAGREPTDEDRGIMLGYQALARGKQLVDLHSVFRNCPADAEGRPALAVARAHWRTVTLRYDDRGGAMFVQGRQRWSFNDRAAWHRRVTLPNGTLPESLRPSRHAPHYGSRIVSAVVPLIPANLRPARALNRYQVLWEADWTDIPVDPMLLRHLHGSLYAVLAVWDLTSLERAVLAGRLTEGS